MNNSVAFSINKKTFISTLAVLLALMFAAFFLTQILPQGSFQRTIIDGQDVVVADSYQVINESRLTFIDFLLAPVLVFQSSDALSALVIIAVILIIGGTFLILEQSGLFNYIISVTLSRFNDNKYQLMGAIVLANMLFGSVLGMFEETLTIVPVVILIALSLNWDTFTGLGMSILAVGMGFASGTFNPFTIGIAQKMANLPLYSGVWLRIVFFILVYFLYLFFLKRYAQKIEKHPELSPSFQQDYLKKQNLQQLDTHRYLNDPQLKRAANTFSMALFLIVGYIVVSFFVSSLSEYSMIFMALTLMLSSFKIAKQTKQPALTTLGKGVLSLWPAVILIVLALAIKHLVVTGNILDTVLNAIYQFIIPLSSYQAIVVIFIFVLLLELFIPSSSAKAFLIMPILVALADLTGISRQINVLAYSFGDGFANMLYPTNAVLLIVLGMSGITYRQWFRWIWKLQLSIFLLCIGFLFIALAIGY